MHTKVKTYEEAAEFIKKIGFMPLSKNPYGFVSLEEITYDQNWHKRNEFDPWLWKDRFALERIASYSRVIGKRPAFISMDWYPYFLAMYRLGGTIEERYEDGIISNMAMRIYGSLKDNRPLNTHELKKLLGINKETKGKFESALIELQGNMDITVFGAVRRISREGNYYGWLVSEYTPVEQWAEPEVLDKALRISKEEAIDKTVSRIKELVPEITDKDAYRFLGIKV